LEDKYAVIQKLPNGITLAVRENHANPTVSLSGLLRCGRIDDPAGLPGLGSFAEEMLGNGTEKHDKFQLAALVEDNGISLGFKLGRENLTFAGRSVTEDFPLLLDVLAEELTASTFPEDEIEKSRKQIATDLLDSMDDTADQASTAVREALYGAGHPFSGRIEGTLESVKAIQQSDLLDWFNSRPGPDGAVVSIVGDITAEQAFSLLNDRLGKWRSPAYHEHDERVAQGGNYAGGSPAVQRLPMRDKSNLSLTWMAPGLSKLDARWPAAFIAAFIFGGDFYSRLNERLRVKDGLTYGSYSRIAAARAQGPVYITAQVSPQKVEQAIAAAMEELKRYCEAGPTEDEVSLAKDYLCGNYPVRLATNGAVAAALTDALYLDRGVDYIHRYPEIIRAVTLEQVRDVAATIYRPEGFLMAAAGSFIEDKVAAV
jgi:zinc protease